MALEKCFQVSTVARAYVLQSYPPFSSKENLNFLPCKRLNSSSILLSSSSSSFAHSFTHRYYSSRIVCKASEAVDVEVVTDCNWNELVLANDSLVLVDFWAPWCGPCRMIAPIINELAKEYAGKIMCFKLNTDDYPNIPTQYGIRSIPTVLFFKNGEKKESIIGAVPKSTLTATIDKYVDI